MNLYFICTGNTCRSAMAEAIMRAKNNPNVQVKSAGIFAAPDMPMSPNAKQVVAEQNISEQHQASQVDEAMLAWADYVITMTEGHLQNLRAMYPQYENKYYQLHALATGQARDVHDPYGGDVSIYRQTFTELQQAIEQIIHKL